MVAERKSGNDRTAEENFFDSLSSYHPSVTAWSTDRLIKVGARVSYHARRWYVHVASAFPLAHHYRAMLA